MCVEIEAKLKVDLLQPTEQRLADLGAEFRNQLVQTDYYFDRRQDSLLQADACLRIRNQSGGEKDSAYLTFKGPRQQAKFKQRREIEVVIEDAGAMGKLLDAMGFETELVFEKRRRVWRLDDCEVALDELPLLGCFVEIEGPDERKIADVQRRLNLADVPHIPQSYAALMRDRLAELGGKDRKILFQSEAQ